MKKFLTLVFEVTDEELDSKRNPFKIEIAGLRVIGASVCDLMEEFEKSSEAILFQNKV